MGSARKSTMIVLWSAIAALLIASVVGVTTIESPSAGEPAASREVELPGGPAADQLRWVLARLGTGATEPELREHFATSFLASVPPSRLTAILVQLGTGGPFRIMTANANGPNSLSVLLAGTTARMSADIEVEAEPPHRITALLFRPVMADRAPLRTFDEVVAALRKGAPEVGFLAAEITDGACSTVRAVSPDQPLPLGSAFKLYVLGALAEAVGRGDVSWDQLVTIRDDQHVHSSLRYGARSGQRQATVQALAQAMIEVSDNTATDVLLELVGRRRVEAAQSRMGMNDPRANIPFLSAREMTLLKWGRPPLAGEYLAIRDAQGRRRFLEQKLPKGPAREEDGQFVAMPTHVDTLEWFASPADVCRAHVKLAELGDRKGLEPLPNILGTNAGMRFDPPPRRFAFKGGSEPGVLAGSWLLEHHDGRRFVIVIQLRNRTGQVDAQALLAAADTYRLLLERK